MYFDLSALAETVAVGRTSAMNKNRMQIAASDAFGNYTKKGKAAPSPINYAAQTGKRG